MQKRSQVESISTPIIITPKIVHIVQKLQQQHTNGNTNRQHSSTNRRKPNLQRAIRMRTRTRATSRSRLPQLLKPRRQLGSERPSGGFPTLYNYCGTSNLVSVNVAFVVDAASVGELEFGFGAGTTADDGD